MLINGHNSKQKQIRFLALLFFFCSLSEPGWTAEKPVNFRKEIQPIFAAHCLKCHGPDVETQEGGLRLDDRASAISELDSGDHAIIPEKPNQSMLLERVMSDDTSEVMPPPESGKKLSEKEINALRRWIKEGANYSRHWAFVKPERVPLPTQVSKPEWIKNGIDNIVLNRLDQEKLNPSQPTSKETLIRRVSLLLIGLPPTPEEVNDFIHDSSPNAYDQLVDRLLNSNAFGERWARVWLDLSRYADSAGYAQDPPRVIWRYRDWVIQSINKNMPFDQFTIEQLAGDLLSKPTEDQLIATAFHRNTMTNSEGGTDDEEFRNAAIIDRVNTTMQVWMGLTMGCAQCHTHKYDPITQEEYFQTFAIFNNTEDSDKGDEQPTITKLMPHQKKQQLELQTKIKLLNKQLKEKQKTIKQNSPTGNSNFQTRYIRVEHLDKKAFLSLAEVQAFTENGKNIATTGKASQSSNYSKNDPNLAIDGNSDGDFFKAKSTTHTNSEDYPWWEVDLTKGHSLKKVVIWNRTDSNLQNRLNHYRVIGLDSKRIPLWAYEEKQAPKPSKSYNIPLNAEELDEQQKSVTHQYFLSHSPELSKINSELVDLRKKFNSIKGVPTPVMRELPKEKQRKSFIQIRGNFRATGKQVVPGILKSFHPLPEEFKKDELNRLALAKWLVSENNPLMARVTVNRFWEQLFGRGLVTTSEDFGVQGESPIQQELLDYLAIQLIHDQWDTKKLLKLIVTSSTFQQSSKVSPELLERDPDNRLFARGPQFRLPAEMIRDNALMVSGLLSRKMYGPSVQPRRPNLGLKAAFGASTDWKTSSGEDQYRRGLYTSWRRTTPYPSMTTFDAPSREVCTIRRIRTNTPLQALVTLNDPVYVEAAQALARRAIAKMNLNSKEKLNYMFRCCLSRSPETEELNRLITLFDELKKQYQQYPEKAKMLATDPLGPAPENTNIIELAAWTAVCNVLLNLDETLSVN